MMMTLIAFAEQSVKTTQLTTSSSTGTPALLNFSWENLVTFIVCFLLYYIFSPIIVEKYKKVIDEKEKEKEGKRVEAADILAKTLKERDEARNQIETDWHNTVIAKFVEQDKKLTQYCRGNLNEHDGMWKRINSHSHLVDCPDPKCHGVTIGKVVITEDDNTQSRRQGDFS